MSHSICIKPLRFAWALIALNAFDALVTTALIEKGLATEANPLMGAAYSISPAFFIWCKLVLVTSLALVLMHHAPKKRIARFALHLGTFVYIALAVFHLKSLFLLCTHG